MSTVKWCLGWGSSVARVKLADGGTLRKSLGDSGRAGWRGEGPLAHLQSFARRSGRAKAVVARQYGHFIAIFEIREPTNQLNGWNGASYLSLKTGALPTDKAPG
jgi:hypothetical protein